jgi:hypothetical protein
VAAPAREPEREAMRAAIQVELPEAPPQTYLTWVDWWRNVERVIRRLESMTSAGRAERVEGPTLLHGPVPGYVSRVFLEEMRRQASHAEQSGKESVGPVLRADPRMLWDAATLLEDQARWLDGWLEDGVVSARLGLSFPGWRVELLRGRVVTNLREQIRRHLHRTSIRGPVPFTPTRRRGGLVLTLVETGEPDDALAHQFA